MPTKKKTREVVFINGCFDVLTPGHYRFIQECVAIALENNAVLILALDGDKKIRRNKGSFRPIFTLAERMQNLRIAFPQIKCFPSFNSNKELEKLIKMFSPILVKGERWRGNVVGKKWAKEIKYLSDHDSPSTTSIIQKIQDKIR